MYILPGPITPQKLRRLDNDIYTDWRAIARNEYAAVLDSILRLVDKDWPGNNTCAETQLINLFTIDDNSDFCIESLAAIIASKDLGTHSALTKILEQIITSETFLFSLFVDLSYKQDLVGLDLSNVELRYQQVVQVLASIPNIVANRLKGKFSNVFVPENFSCFVLIAVLKSIYFMAEINRSEQSNIFETKFLSKLFSRFLIDFNINRTSIVIPKLIKVLGIWSEKNDYYTEIIQNLLLNLNRNAIEIVSFYLLQSPKINSLLGNAIEKSADWRYCFHTKFPLLEYHKNDCIVINLVRYLAGQTNEKEDLSKLFSEVLKSWSSKILLTSHSVDQHLYLSKFIVLSSGNFELNNSVSTIGEIKQIIHRGIQNHMESLNHSIRAMGMIIAEIVCNRLNDAKLEKEEELRFEYSSFSPEIRAMVEELRKLSDHYLDDSGGPAEELNENDVLTEIFNSVSVNISSDVLSTRQGQANASVPIQHNEIEYVSLPARQPQLAHAAASHLVDDDDLDSDDDLEPYDMSNDTSTKTDNAPKYLIDLKESLLETDDPDIFQSSMETCATLINEKLPNDDYRIGLDLLHILIGLDQKFYTENFEAYRFAGCVAICLCYPKVCAELLCTEFHTEVGKYSIAKKVLMLDILCETSRSLSRITKSVQPTAGQGQISNAPKKLVELDAEAKRSHEARQMIRERVEHKTRRFATKTAHPFIHAQRNRFADVAGYFFFPLLYGFGKQQLTLMSSNNTLKYDTDNILLTAFLNTIATVIIAAQNCPIASKFGTEVFRLSCLLRFHAESQVRLGVLHMIAAVFLAVPKGELLNYCYNDIFETKEWLEQILSLNIVHGEKNVECRETAKHVLAMCLDTIT